MEIVINKLYISVDGTVYVIIITAINIVTLFDFLLLLVPQLRLNSESGSKIDAIAAMGHSKAKSVLGCPIGFCQ